ncbi:MAG: hypothetical protein JHC81_08890 [Brevundimonas sp.]|jgi:hypothetical protein|uniref:hypothetical protein n=1 Tax=Brevundimonas sp. TaxID=1871086 RepID=UPI001A22267E|nr:hypothetical protein [Brevundimonas sp.]MBJ7447638.1 hypothetical protein [Brevundimonas sp.]
MDNEITPWIPLPDLPQTPCGIEVEGAPEHVSVRVVYSFYEGDRDLLIEFQAEAFGCFSEIAAPSTTVSADYPRLTHPTYSRYLWPLMEVTNSSWLSSYLGRLWWSDRPYRHYRIVSDDGTFDAITCHEPVARWEAVKS